MERKSVFITNDSHITGEIYGVFIDDEGLLRNVKIVDKVLALKLRDTPVEIPNPEHAPIVEEAFVAAEQKLADDAAEAAAASAEDDE